MKNNNALNLTVLTGMHPCEFEEWRERGENERHILTSAVAQLLYVPAGWNVNGEYRGEFGGFFPVQLRYTPPGEAFSICVCSPGDVSGEWLIVLVSADGNCVREVLRLMPFDPQRISDLIAAAAQASLLEHCAAGMAEYLAEGEFA